MRRTTTLVMQGDSFTRAFRVLPGKSRRRAFHALPEKSRRAPENLNALTARRGNRATFTARFAKVAQEALFVPQALAPSAKPARQDRRLSSLGTMGRSRFPKPTHALLVSLENMKRQKSAPPVRKENFLPVQAHRLAYPAQTARRPWAPGEVLGQTVASVAPQGDITTFLRPSADSVQMESSPRHAGRPPAKAVLRVILHLLALGWEIPSAAPAQQDSTRPKLGVYVESADLVPKVKECPNRVRI